MFYLFSLKFDVENEDKYLKLKDVSKYKEVLYTIQNNNGVEKEIKTNSLILAIGHSARDTFLFFKGTEYKNGTKAFCYGCEN